MIWEGSSSSSVHVHDKGRFVFGWGGGGFGSGGRIVEQGRGGKVLLIIINIYARKWALFFIYSTSTPAK